ncbi:hypothetical protein BN1708_015854 [Verticillium longisporum]|uniref:Terpene cyclase/mutase family member n=1 Tax=Verticillium longisporum TaxID=100787 RepID=A0A0G4M9D8_VERLO|nr:hypothetical protein BN1708_015854 [Verticillium longisporum]
MSCSGTNSFCEEKSDFSPGDFAEATTDPSRWRLSSDGGRNVWHYLTRDEDIQKWPQTAVDRYHLGLSTGFSKVEPAKTPMQSVINAVSVYSKLQLPSGHWACEEGGPLFLLPGLVITWYVTEASIPEAFKIEIKNYLFARQNPDDGSWGLHIEAEGSVFGLAMNYTALRLLGVRADHPRLCKARSELHRLGGALNAPHWAKFWLSVLGVMPWDIVNPVPPELWLLPDWVPFAPWRWWIHIRQVFLPMSWVWSRRWQYPLCDLTRDIRQELFVQPPELIDFSAHRNSISPRDNYHSKSWLLNTANWLIVNIWNPYLRHDKLTTAAEAWVYDLIQHEDENPEYVNLGPVNAPMNTLVCYIQQGPKSTAMARHLDHLMDYLWKKDEGMLMNGTNGAQVWDTAFSIQAIVDTGLADDPRYQPTLMKALEFLEEHQIRDDCREQGICYRHYRKGAWPFSTRQQGYAVTDCTAEGLKSVLALQSIPGYPNIVTEDRLCDAVNILLSMQNNTGGCSSYELRRGSEHLEYLNAAEVFGQIMVEYDYVDPESVADHSHRMTFMALLAPQNLDQAKVVKMCLVHDLAETVVGDITPADGVSREEKTHREEAAMHWMTTHWGDFGREVHHLWIEFEAGLTPEGEFAQDLDKLEMMLQALEYERDAELAVDLGEFFAVAGRIRTPRAQAWTAEVLRDRELLWAGKEHVRGDLGVEGGLLQKKQEEQDLYYNQTVFVCLQPRSGKTDAHSFEAQRSTRGDAKKADDDQRVSAVGDVSIRCLAGRLIEVQARHKRWGPTKRPQMTRHSGTVKRHGDMSMSYGVFQAAEHMEELKVACPRYDKKTRYGLWRVLLISESTTW